MALGDRDAADREPGRMPRREADRLGQRERIADAGGRPADDGEKADAMAARRLVEPGLPAALVHFAHALVGDRRPAGACSEQRCVAARVDGAGEGERARHGRAPGFVLMS
jgi:hypothetical protein